MRITHVLLAGLAMASAVAASAYADSDVLPRIDQRFAADDVAEAPSFQRHVVPLFGRLGCNGRACHGSFQGRGGFQLSLFGYDFEADHNALLDEKSPRVSPGKPNASLIIEKPTDADMHEGGLRYEKGAWQHHVLRNWIAEGAKFEKSDIVKLRRLDITPSELIFAKAGEQEQLKVVAIWADGTQEDVTPLCRFTSNSDSIAAVDEQGVVTAVDPGDTHIVVAYDNGVVPIPAIRPVSDQVGKKYPKVATPTKVDELVVEKLRKLGIVPAKSCTDAEFLRRVSLDMIGTLPTADDVAKFLADKSPNKRAEKIDELLQTPGYAAWWTTKLCDFTGNNELQLNNVLPRVRGNNYSSPSQAWYDWIYERVESNASYDKLAEGIVLAKSRGKDQSYTDYCKEMSEICGPGGEKSFAELESMPFYWARRDFREVEAQAITFAYAFMGVRIQCAQCHKHPFDQWTKDDFAQFQNFFGHTAYSQNPGRGETAKEYEAIVKALGIDTTQRGNEVRNQIGQFLSQGKTVPFPELVVTGVRSGGRGRGGNTATEARLLGGETFDLSKTRDAREPLMDWLRAKDNPYFARAFVNRVWANYFNVGIVEPPDDMSLANAPSNQALLDYLARGFIESGFDMKWVHREIANSATYQRSWQTNETNAADERNFSRSVPRRMPAEVTYDALQIATASDERAARLQAELDGRAIAMASPPRNANNGGTQYALTVFGRSTRESNCDCDRSMESSLLQTVYLQNDSDVLSMIKGGDSWLGRLNRELGGDSRAASNAKAVDATALVERAYLRTVSRYPDASEMKRSLEFIASSSDTVNGLEGVLWALINTKEFILNH
jgi:hypothetical protein